MVSLKGVSVIESSAARIACPLLRKLSKIFLSKVIAALIDVPMVYCNDSLIKIESDGRFIDSGCGCLSDADFRIYGYSACSVLSYVVY